MKELTPDVIVDHILGGLEGIAPQNLEEAKRILKEQLEAHGYVNPEELKGVVHGSEKLDQIYFACLKTGILLPLSFEGAKIIKR